MNLGGMVLGYDGACPVCSDKTVIVKKSQKEVGEDIIVSYRTFCLKCQKVIKEGEAKVKVDKYGRTKVEI
jgi:hypothetical protein